MSFVLVVDSSSDIPQEKASALGIKIVPMPVNIEGKTYLEGIDIFPNEFYSQFETYKELPKTSQPNLNTLIEVYNNVLSEGHEVIAIHLSSGLSSTVSTANLAREMTMNPEKVHIIDSLGASLGYGLIALLVSQNIKDNTSWDEIKENIVEIRNKMRYVFTLDTIDYLVKGGRVSKTSGFIGGLLDIKPILHINEGKIEPFAKVRSRRAAIRKLVEVMEKEIKNSESQIIGISHANCLNEAEILAEEIRKKMIVKDILLSQIGAVIGSHAGPGTLALFYQN